MCRINRFQTRKKQISTSQLLNDLKLKPIEAYIDQRQMSWAGHVSRMTWNRLPRKMLTAWCNSKRPKGAPQNTYGQNLNQISDEGSWIIKPGWKDRKIEFTGGKKPDHSDNHYFSSSTFFSKQQLCDPKIQILTSL